MTTQLTPQSAAEHGAVAATLQALAAQLTGALHLPGDARYTELATPWNVAVANTPVAVVEAGSPADVAAALRFAGAHQLQVSVQATGHGAVAHHRPTLQISTRALRELTISPTGAVRAGAGLQWSDVIEAAAPLGYAGLAGSAPGVGVVGFLTGGGIGPVARTYGVSSDYVTAFDVVTGDGELRRATATENPALFWGLRGGKGALGFVTAVEFDLVPLTELFGGCLYFDGADAAPVLHAWREWTPTLPEQATSSIALMRLPAMPGVPEPLAGKVTVAVRYAWVGDPDDGSAAFAPMAAAGRVVLGGVGVLPYTAIGSIHNDPVDPMPTAEAATLLQTLPVDAVDALMAAAGPDAPCPQVIVELRHLGGAIGRQQSGASAFSFRDAAYSLLTIGIAAPPVVDATHASSAAILAALAPWSDGSCLPNFHATSDPGQIKRKYDPATLARLATLATTYDPHGVVADAAPFRDAAWMHEG
ncbi:FAD-binding oxidoreductase [uncultured Jatrophihabitans sp.]|uniref:FAD-binding oxidoreductase n=1 Tax=uncultured Jatrophihabitans sp. TaxID=1610747 RepID=UPI0035CB3557